MPKLRAVVDAVWQSLWEADSEAIGSYLHPDFVLHEPPSLPTGAAYRGIEGVAVWKRSLHNAWEVPTFQLHHVTLDPPYASLHVTFAARCGGRDIRMPANEVWCFESGQVTEITRYYYDTKLLADWHAGKSLDVFIPIETSFDAIASASPGDAARESSRQFVADTLADVMAGKWERVGPRLAPKFAVYEAPNLPFSGIHRGTEGYAKLCLQVGETWNDRDFEFIPGRSIADDRFVVMQQILRGKINGRYLAAHVSEVFEVRENKLQRIVPFYFDTAAIASYHQQSA